MQSFIKIRGVVLEKNAHKILTLCNFNKDLLPEKGQSEQTKKNNIVLLANSSAKLTSAV